MTGDRLRPWTVIRAFATSDARLLWRMRMPLVFMFVVPAVLSVLLGPAISGGDDVQPGRSVVGFAVLFSFMTINYVGIALFREFVHNTWTRQVTFRPARWAFLTGKILPVAGVGFFQLVVFGTAAIAIYHVPLHGNVLQLVLVALALGLCGPVIGVLLYNVTSSTSAFQSFAYLLMIGLGGIGGVIVEPGHLPGPSRWLSPATPHHWALRAFTEATVGSGSWAPVLQALAVLTGLVVTIGGIALMTFDYRSEKVVLA
jgi:ABC-2 type transport system permease protein